MVCDLSYSYHKVTYSDPRVTNIEPKVTHSDPTLLPLPQPVSQWWCGGWQPTLEARV